jgi:hypothetical protein
MGVDMSLTVICHECRKPLDLREAVHDASLPVGERFAMHKECLPHGTPISPTPPRLAREGEGKEYAEAEMLAIIDQRDEAENALSQAYFLVTGNSPEWSNNFGYEQALEDIKDASDALRKSLATSTFSQGFAAGVEAAAAKCDDVATSYLNGLRSENNPDRQYIWREMRQVSANNAAAIRALTPPPTDSGAHTEPTKETK